MQSAFIDIGLERTAFLHVADIWERPPERRGWRGPSRSILAEGQNLIVQVLKDPIGTKGARLSTQISIAGRMLVYLPQDKHIGISQRIEDEAGREQLRERVSRCCPIDEPGGYIVRTMAENASDEELAADIAYLQASCGPRSRTAPWAPARRRCCTRTSTWPSACCAIWSPTRPRIVADSRENFQKLSGLRRRIHAAGGPAARALHRRAPAVRPARRRGRDREGPGPPRRSQIRRLPDHRPDRGDDHHRREHRRLRRRAQLRRHHLQDQPRGRPGHRPPAARAQPGRHHHRRLHRHGERSSTATPCSRSSARPCRATTPR
jgi:hypothetical protein